MDLKSYLENATVVPEEQVPSLAIEKLGCIIHAIVILETSKYTGLSET